MRRRATILVLWMLLHSASTLATAPPAPDSRAYEELQRKYETALQDIARLRSELEAIRRERTAAPARPPGAAETASGDDPQQVGNAHFMAQRYSEAITAYTRAIEMAPRDARPYKYRGLAHAKLGQAQQAYGDLSKAIELDPQDAIIYNQRGLTSFATGNGQAALKDFTRAIELRPQLAEAYNNRGIVQRKLGDYRQASTDLERAAQLGMELAPQHLQVLRDEVRQAQARLRHAGLYPGSIDGAPGPQTVAALRQYQTMHGLPVSGRLDDATRNALGLALEPAATGQTGEPPRFAYQPAPEYPEIARQHGWAGTVTLHLELRADGSVGEVRVARSSGHTVLDTAAQETAQSWQHVPAVQGGTPVTRWAEVHLTFTLDTAQDSSATRQP